MAYWWLLLGNVNISGTVLVPGMEEWGFLCAFVFTVSWFILGFQCFDFDYNYLFLGLCHHNIRQNACGQSTYLTLFPGNIAKSFPACQLLFYLLKEWNIGIVLQLNNHEILKIAATFNFRVCVLLRLQFAPICCIKTLEYLSNIWSHIVFLSIWCSPSLYVGTLSIIVFVCGFCLPYFLSIRNFFQFCN